MIRVRGMSKSYRTGKLVTPVLRNVDLDVAEGEFLALVGPSGSGKTTLLHAIGGLDSDYEGLIEVDGKDLRGQNDVTLSDYRNRHVGFVFQSFYLLPHLSCRENVALPGVFARGPEALDQAALDKRAQEVLDWVALGDRAESRPTALSGGQRQRIAIARALFNRPRLMLCDEPTGNLDSKMGAQIIDLFRSLNRDENITVVIVTHDARVSAAAGRRVVVDDGQLRETPRDHAPTTSDPATSDQGATP